MNQERLDLLAAIYKNAKSYDNMDEPYLVSDVNGVIYDQFNLQYLEAKGLIDIVQDANKVYAVINIDGVDVVEHYQSTLDKFDRVLMDTRVLSLLVDKRDRKIGL